MSSPAGGAIHPLIAPVPVGPSVGTVHTGRFLRSEKLGDKTVEETSSEGDDGNWDDLVIEVRLSLRVLSGIALKQTEDRKVKLASKTGRAGNKPAEGLRQNEGEDAGDEKENDKERYPLGRQHFLRS